jgi:acyl carrier protein
MNTNSNNDTVRQFIKRHFSHARTHALGNDDPLLESGIVDSMGVLDLVSFIESEFGISVADEDLVQEHFGSVRQITAYIASKQSEVS